jgi:hypothetical protein
MTENHEAEQQQDVVMKPAEEATPTDVAVPGDTGAPGDTAAGEKDDDTAGPATEEGTAAADEPKLVS